MDFKHVPNQYRPVPFWSWNEKLDTKTTLEQIEDMLRTGIGGYFMHARPGLQTEYMGQEWFDNIATGIEAGKRLDMSAWAYDENGWPSGFGNGVINGMGVKYQQKYLRFEEGEKHTETTIANIDGLHFYYDANPFYVDLLDKNVVKAFIDFAYAPYYEKYGKELTGFFTDEPQITRYGTPWSFVLEEAFQKEYNEELLPLLPQLFFDKGDYQNTRLKFWRLVTKLFADSCLKQIYDWCENHGLQLTGHMLLEETLFSQLTSNGAVMPQYEYYHVPGMDSLRRGYVDKTTCLQLTSVAQQLGKKQVLTETFACTGWNVSFEELKSMYEWQMVRGVNLLCLHLTAYSLRGIRKRDYPSAFSYQQPWWDQFRAFTDTVSRIGMLLTEGEIKNDTLLIHPQSTAWVLYHGEEIPEIHEYNQKFNDVIADLESKHIAFNLGDEILMEKYAKVVGNQLVIGKQSYSTVVLPPHLVLLASTEKLLAQFQAAGGKVVTDLNEIAPSDVVDNKNILATKRIFPDYDMYYFVNPTEELQPVTLKYGTCVLNPLTGETEPLSEQPIIQPKGSLIVLDYRTECSKAPVDTTEYASVGTEGTWEILKQDHNALTLDRCDYYFDGQLIEKNGPVTSIQGKACDLCKPVKIDMHYTVQAEYVPRELYLVCETPEIFTITVNGKLLEKKDCGYFRDKTFRKLNLSGYFQEGENTIDVACNFAQTEAVYENAWKAKQYETERNKLFYDMEIESIYLVGDFSVKTDGTFTALSRNAEEYCGDALRYSGNFVISQPKSQLAMGNIEQQGYPFFAGKITLQKKFNAEAGKPYRFAFQEKNAAVVQVKVNGKPADTVYWHPYSADLTPYIVDGENTLEITLTHSLRNLLGPHHLEIGEFFRVSPSSFYKETGVWGKRQPELWNDDYCFVAFGLR